MVTKFEIIKGAAPAANGLPDSNAAEEEGG
jgi:hypothetical protein